MPFTLLPAVDVAAGQAVRLVRGEGDRATVHGDPADAALAWQAGGAEWIHLVDLDAAFGHGSNAELLAAVIGRLDVDVQLSGGIGDDASLERALASGCTRVVIGTAALADPAWCARAIVAHGDRIAVALDVRLVEQGRALAHRLAARGSPGDGGDLWPALEGLERAGCARYVVTDVRRDGTLGGPNLPLYAAVTGATVAPVVASGGIATVDDLSALAAPGTGLEGAVVGQALYAGRFTLPEALAAVRRPAR